MEWNLAINTAGPRDWSQLSAEERLATFEQWLQAEYDACCSIWKEATSPQMRGLWFLKMQHLQIVARHLITGRDDLVPLYDERLMPFARHVDFLKKWEKEE